MKVGNPLSHLLAFTVFIGFLEMQPTIDLAAVLSPKHIGGIQLFVSGDQSVSPLSSSPIWKLLVA